MSELLEKVAAIISVYDHDSKKRAKSILSLVADEVRKLEDDEGFYVRLDAVLALLKGE